MHHTAFSKTGRIVRRTALEPGEFNRIFQMIDRDIMAVITSEEADRITPLMSKIYLRLLQAPASCIEREGVLRFEAEFEEHGVATAWKKLCRQLAVSSQTAHKALGWLNGQGVIGYFAGRNGVGIRIFLNRATASIGRRADRSGQKILAFPGTSTEIAPTSPGEMPFKVTFGDSENSEKLDLPSAPEVAWREPAQGNSTQQNALQPGSTEPAERLPSARPAPGSRPGVRVANGQDLELIARTLAPELAAAARAAAAAEFERSRAWFAERALPKAVRVAQHETFALLRKLGVICGTGDPAGTGSGLGQGTIADLQPHDRALGEAGIQELAESCRALWEAQGKAVEATLAELVGSGWLSSADAERVRVCVDATSGVEREQTGREVESSLIVIEETRE